MLHDCTKNGRALSLELNKRGFVGSLPVYRYYPTDDYFERITDTNQVSEFERCCYPKNLPEDAIIFRPWWPFGLDYIRARDYPQLAEDTVLARQWRKANAS